MCLWNGTSKPLDHLGSDANFLGHLPCGAGGLGKLPAQRSKLPARIKIAYVQNFYPVSTNMGYIWHVSFAILNCCKQIFWQQFAYAIKEHKEEKNGKNEQVRMKMLLP